MNVIRILLLILPVLDQPADYITAFTRGCEERSLPESANPYPKRSQAAKDWVQGRTFPNWSAWESAKLP